jgi:hypothetical protein
MSADSGLWQMLQVLGSKCSIQAPCSRNRPAAAAAAVPRQQQCQLARRPVRLAAAAEAGSTTTKSINPFAAPAAVPPAAATVSQPAASSSSSPERSEAWEVCMLRLQDMGFSEQQAELFVQRAFGWGPKARSYWRHEKVSGSMKIPPGHCVVFQSQRRNKRRLASWSGYRCVLSPPAPAYG